jgi:myo-inositol-1(or 4)-monophosphatase
MTNEQWLEIFKDIGRSMREGLLEILSREGGKVPLGKGAGGDKTFPVDKWAEDIILSALEKAHQQGETFTLISEELGIRKFGAGGKVVLVDPIDGSNNAKSGLPFFSTSLALLNGETLSELAAGYIANLAGGDEFWAAEGTGAYKNGVRITTSPDEGLNALAFEASAPGHDIPPLLPIMNKARRARCLGSTALDLAYLASGAISVFATATASRTFDFAAGMLLVREAGGVMTSLSGDSLAPVVVGLGRTVPLLASANATLHASVLELLKRR